jgi:hypothetical protein
MVYDNGMGRKMKNKKKRYGIKQILLYNSKNGKSISQIEKLSFRLMEIIIFMWNIFQNGKVKH